MTVSEKQLIQEIKLSLPNGWSKSLARKHKVSRMTLSRVLNGYDTDHPLFEEILKLAEATVQDKHRKHQEVVQRVQKLKSTDLSRQ